MNECVETLNRWGEGFSAFAWPMLWQSSLLIAVIFAFDLMFARRVRASVRYALWMVVLVKLLLPPALALPTGATWWLWRPHPVMETPAIQNYTVSFDNSPPEALPPPATVPVVEPPPKLSADAWVLLSVAAMGAGLLSWLAFRWRRVAARVRRTAIAPAELNGILEEARQLAGLRRPLRLKLIDDRQSPAVYGLFRPSILLPRTLANQLSGRQLRAVLLHEAMHLRRGDVWVNFAQTLLQILYWWHPLFWLANARIRRVREEAVDDAVMLALRDGADAYAPTLLEVAKFAFRRPLASLGLIGILESRSALRQRVERLVDFQPSGRTGLTILSLFGIFAFSAVALPMGQGPVADESAASPVPNRNSPQTSPASLLSTSTGQRFEVEHYRILGNSVLSAKTIAAALNNIDGAFGTNVSFEKIETVAEQLQQAYHDRGYETVRVALPKQQLENHTVKIQVLEGDAPATNAETFGPYTSLSANAKDLETRTFRIDPNTFYSHLQQKMGLSSSGLDLQRTSGGLLYVGDSNLPQTVSALAKEYLEQLGLNLSPPKALDYDERREILLVKATSKDMEVIEKAMPVSADPPQIHIKARFFEVPKEFFSSAAAESLPPGMTNGGILTAAESKKVLRLVESQKGSEELAEPEVVTLSARQTQMRATITQSIITNFICVASAGAVAGTPEPHGKFSDGSAFVPQTTQVKTGPILDVVPDLLADGRNTINLTTIASHIDFLGYSTSRGLVPNITTNAAGTGFSPVFQVGEAVLSKNIWDGQTLVLFPRYKVLSDGKTNDRNSMAVEEKNRDKVEIVLVTATLIDPVGNHWHSDYYDFPYAPNPVPGARTQIP